MIELVGAGEYANRPIGELSGGEQQRLLIAQALVRRPQLLLLDEPLDSLDLPNQAVVAALVHEICRGEGVAVLLVAHDVNPLLPYLDRVVYLAAGQAVAGPVEQVITGETLTGLYGLPVEVLKASDGRLVVVGQPEAPAHHHDRHSHDHHGHDHHGHATRGTATTMHTDPHLTWNVVHDVSEVLEYHFMVNALLAGSVVAVMAGLLGWFMVLRRETFAGHTLSMMAFPGAAGAALIGVAATWGYFVFCVAGALAIGRLSGGRATLVERAVGGHRRRAGVGARPGLSVREPVRRRARRPGQPAVRHLPGHLRRAGAGPAGGRGGVRWRRSRRWAARCCSPRSTRTWRARGACRCGRWGSCSWCCSGWRSRRRARSRGCCSCSRCS